MISPMLTLTDKPTPAMRKAILDRLIRFNEGRTGRKDAVRPLVITVTDPATDAIVGGLWGDTVWGQLRIDLLFLPDDLRGTGLGRRLIHDAEAEALRRGCRGAWVETYSFQARGFYERLGYTVFGTNPDYPPGHCQFFLRKSLGTGATE
jgi:GNAT superfamily N-acetyltransferase